MPLGAVLHHCRDKAVMLEHIVQLRCTSTRERVGARCLNSETIRSCVFLVPRGHTDPIQLKSENRENFETGHCDRSSVNSSMRHFIDDSHQSAQGTPREARKLIVAAGRTFTKEAQKHLRVRFADKKTAIVSSHQKLVSSVVRQFWLQEEAVQTQTVGLGVDVSAGKTPTVTSARRKKRIQKFLERKARLHVLTRRAGSLAQNNYKCGLHPAAMYGDEVSGISGGLCSAWPRRCTAR